MHARLCRWGSWCAGGLERSAPISSAYAMKGRARSSSDNIWSASVPFDALEAEQTNRAIQSLPPVLRQTVKVVYMQHAGNTVERQAKALGIAKETMRRRLCQADARLRQWLRRPTASAKPVQNEFST